MDKWCPYYKRLMPLMMQLHAWLDTKTSHQNLIFHLSQRSIERRLAHGTLDIGACQNVKGQYNGVLEVKGHNIGDVLLAHDTTSRATIVLQLNCVGFISYCPYIHNYVTLSISPCTEETYGRLCLVIDFVSVLIVYRIAGIFRGYKFSQMDLYKGFRGFYFRGLSSSLLAHAHINMQLYLHTVSLESRLSLYKIIESMRHYILHL